MILKYNFLTIIWILVILILTLLPGKAIPEVDVIGIDKIVHILLFGILAFLFNYNLNRQNQFKKIKINITWFSFFFCIIYGTLIEFAQNYIPARSSSILDIIANTIGVIIGYILFRILFSRKFKDQHPR